LPETFKVGLLGHGTVGAAFVELLSDRLLGPRSVGQQDDCAVLAAPGHQPVGDPGENRHAIVDHAPYVAQDQPVALGQRGKVDHSRPAIASASSIALTSSGLLSSRSV
jgi:hypothetical protein